MTKDNAHATERFPRLLAVWVDQVCRHPWLVLSLSLLLVGISLWFTWNRLEYQTHRDDLLSPHKDYFKRWQQYVKEFGEDDDMVVAVKGTDRKKMIAALEELAGEVHKHPDQFDRVFFKADLRALKNRALLYLPADQIRQIQETLNNTSMRLLLELGNWNPLITWKSVTFQELLREGQRRLANQQAEEAPFFKQLEAVCLAAEKSLDDPRSYKNPWHTILPASAEQQQLLDEPQYFFSGDDTLAFLLLRPIREDKFTGTEKSVTALRQILDGIKPKYPDLEIGLTGYPVLECDEMVASEQDSNLASWLALAGVALLYLVTYRSWRYPLFTVATLLAGTAWAMGWTTWTVGHLNILSAGFAVMLIGMGDYGVLWVTRYNQERSAGSDLLTAMRITAASVGPGILTAGTTTALAFFATMLADFKAVVELGWIAGCGILLCALACFIVLPALVAILDRRFGKKPAGAILNFQEIKEDRRQWLPALMRRPRLVIGFSLALTLGLGFFGTRVRYDHNLLHMQARGLDSVKWEETLIQHTAGASWHALSYTTTPEEALALKAQYEKLPEISRVVEIASLVPREQERKLEQLQDIQYRLRRLPPCGMVVPHDLPSIKDLLKSLGGLQDGLVHWKENQPAPQTIALVETLQRLRQKLRAADPALAPIRLKEFEELLTRDLIEDLHRLRNVSTPKPITVEDLPPGLRERYIGKTGKWLLCVFARNSLWEYDSLDQFIQQVQKVDPEATGKPFTTLEGLRAMKNGFLWASVYASLAMVLVLLLDFRSWKCTLVALLPVVMGMLITFGIMFLLGIDFNPANMISLPLILGVGMDNGVHVLHDYRSRPPGLYNLCQATGRGIMVAALTTILGFGTLMIASHQGIASLGLVLSLGVTSCMVSALVFLPALLRLMSIRQITTQMGQATRKVA